MNKLSKRKTRLMFETGDELRERGKHRAVLIEAHPTYCVLRLKGLRTTYTMTYGAIYHQAVKIEVAAQRAKKKEKKHA